MTREEKVQEIKDLLVIPGNLAIAIRALVFSQLDNVPEEQLDRLLALYNPPEEEPANG